MPCLLPIHARVLLSGERASVDTPCRGGPEALSVLQARGGVLPSGAFPEPAAPSYGAPGVEFMGLHRENNAVVQVCFLPGQVRPLCALLPLRSSRGAWGEAGIW